MIGSGGTQSNDAVTAVFELAPGGEEMLTIHVAGDTDTRRRPATAKDRERFRADWEWFRGGHRGPRGTPLEAWPDMSPELAADLRHRHVLTVEALAACSPQAVPNGYTLTRKAREWLTSKVEDAAARELEVRDGEIDALRRLVREQGEQIAQLLAARKDK
jgi:hypothetical protein